MSVPIAVSEVTVDLGDVRVLSSVALGVAPGEWVSVVGPNGAGKSTLLRAVTGGVGLASGGVTVGDREVGSMAPRERARLMALVPQTPMLPEAMRVIDYVLLGRTAYLPFFGTESPADVELALRVLDQLDLAGLAGRELGQLSGGERQRTVLSRALVQEAPVLLLDEPTAALDVGHQQDVLELVDRLRREGGLTVLSTMHDLTLAGQYADRLVMLDRGRVVAAGCAREVLTEERIARHYGAHVRVVEDDGALVVVPRREVRT